MKDKKACEGLIDKAMGLMVEDNWNLLPIKTRKEFVTVLAFLWKEYKKAV